MASAAAGPIDDGLHQFMACQKGRQEVVSLLLADPRVEVNKPRDMLATPFYVACANGHKEVVSLLLADKRIDVNTLTNTGATPFFIACQEGHKEVVSLLLADKRIDVNTPNSGRVTPLYIACAHGRKEVVSLLLGDMRIDLNKPMKGGFTPFIIACDRNRVEVISLLLADMRTDVTQTTDLQGTPFYVACQNGHQEAVELLLDDPRIDINKPETEQCTPLWMASHNGHLGVVQLILASGREVDTQTKSLDGVDPWNNKNPAEIAQWVGAEPMDPEDTEEDYIRAKKNCLQIADLIESFDLDPATTRQQLRELPHLRTSFFSAVFALVVFLCDDLLVIKPLTTKTSRFLRIAVQLPMELQMVLCNRLFGSGKDHVLTNHSEPAFKKLARKLLVRE